MPVPVTGVRTWSGGDAEAKTKRKGYKMLISLGILVFL
jgi:hypothetical protein